MKCRRSCSHRGQSVGRSSRLIPRGSRIEPKDINVEATRSAALEGLLQSGPGPFWAALARDAYFWHHLRLCCGRSVSVRENRSWTRCWWTEMIGCGKAVDFHDVEGDEG